MIVLADGEQPSIHPTFPRHLLLHVFSRGQKRLHLDHLGRHDFLRQRERMWGAEGVSGGPRGGHPRDPGGRWKRVHMGGAMGIAGGPRRGDTHGTQGKGHPRDPREGTPTGFGPSSMIALVLLLLLAPLAPTLNVSLITLSSASSGGVTLEAGSVPTPEEDPLSAGLSAASPAPASAVASERRGPQGSHQANHQIDLTPYTQSTLSMTGPAPSLCLLPRHSLGPSF